MNNCDFYFTFGNLPLNTVQQESFIITFTLNKTIWYYFSLNVLNGDTVILLLRLSFGPFISFILKQVLELCALFV